jgi:hypothetical protein
VTKKQAVVKGALEVPEDALHDREMGLMGTMHVEAHLLDRIVDVRPGEGEVLESPGQAAVGNRVAHTPHVRGDLGLSVDRCGAGLAVDHGNTLKNILSVLALVKGEAIWSLLDVEEVVERVETLHRELLLKSCSGTLKQLRARGGEDDVVEVE